MSAALPWFIASGLFAATAVVREVRGRRRQAMTEEPGGSPVIAAAVPEREKGRESHVRGA